MPRLYQSLQQSRESKGPPQRGTITGTQESCFPSKQGKFSSLLLNPVCRSKTQRTMETSYRPQLSEQIHQRSTLQDGDNQNGSQRGETKRLWGQPRLVRRVPSRTNTQSVQEIPSLCHKRPSLLFQSTTFRSQPQPLGLHTSYGRGDCHSPPPSTGSHFKLPGRHTSKTSVPSRPQKGSTVSDLAAAETGLDDQLGEIRPRAFPNLHPPRYAVQDSREQGFPAPQTGGQDHQHHQFHTEFGKHVGKELPQPHRPAQRGLRPPGIGQDLSQTHPVCSHRCLDAELRGPGCTDSHLEQPGTGARSLDEQIMAGARSTAQKAVAFALAMLRCEHRGLGGPSSPRFPGDSRYLVETGGLGSHQSPRTPSGMESPPPLDSAPQGLAGSRLVRQLDSGGIHSQPGWNPLQRTHQSCQGDTTLVQRLPHRPDSETHPREAKRTGGHTLQKRSSDPHGVVAPPARLHGDHTVHGDSTRRPVCHTVEPQGTDFCLTGTGSSSYSRRCPQSGLDEHVCLRLSPLGPATKGTAENRRNNVPNHPDRSPQLEQIVDIPSPGPGNSSPHKTAGETGSSQATKVRDISPGPSVPQASRLDSIRTALRSRRFSEPILERIATARRPSTLKVYEGKWKVFSNWCDRRSLDPLCLLPHHLADFFLWLFEERNLAPITIKGYRSMISDTYRHHGGFEVGRDKDLSDLLANFERSRPRTRVLFPSWDIGLVLKWLDSASFEPLQVATLRSLTLKTCFLTALASAARVSEIHALAADANHLQFRNDGSVLLLTEAGFVAKNRLPTTGNQSIVIKPLPVNQSSPDHLHDPVRALSIYLERTRSLRDSSQQLFLSFAESRPRTSPQTISSWLRTVIRSAYRDASIPLPGPSRPKAHDVRAIAASLAFDRNIAVSEIIQAVGWKSSSTFGKFYLRDLSQDRPTLSRVGAISAAQLVTHPTQ